MELGAKPKQRDPILDILHLLLSCFYGLQFDLSQSYLYESINNLICNQNQLNSLENKLDHCNYLYWCYCMLVREFCLEITSDLHVYSLI